MPWDLWTCWLVALALTLTVVGYRWLWGSGLKNEVVDCCERTEGLFGPKFLGSDPNGPSGAEGEVDSGFSECWMALAPNLVLDLDCCAYMFVG